MSSRILAASNGCSACVFEEDMMCYASQDLLCRGSLYDHMSLRWSNCWCIYRAYGPPIGYLKSQARSTRCSRVPHDRKNCLPCNGVTTILEHKGANFEEEQLSIRPRQLHVDTPTWCVGSLYYPVNLPKKALCREEILLGCRRVTRA